MLLVQSITEICLDLLHTFRNFVQGHYTLLTLAVLVKVWASGEKKIWRRFLHIRYPRETAWVMYMYLDIKQTDGQTEYSRAPEIGAYLHLTTYSKLYAPYICLSRPYTQQQHSNEFQNSKNYGNIILLWNAQIHILVQDQGNKYRNHGI